MAFNKFPSIKVNSTAECVVGFNAIGDEIAKTIHKKSANTVVIECYQGVFVDDLIVFIRKTFPQAQVIESYSALKSEAEIRRLTHPSVTDDRIFGFITNLKLSDLFDSEKIAKTKVLMSTNRKLTFIVGTGASLLEENPDLLIYADMARWEIQLRMRKNQITNIGILNHNDPFETQYKRGYFLDWRLCDNVKKELMPKWDYILDTNDRFHPKMITAWMFDDALTQTVAQPFSVVPFFDPGPWGGQWMKEKFDLDRSAPNFAWGFNCVPEENSLLLDFNGVKFETPAINVVFFRPTQLLGEKVQQIFGDEFPIRFDFLDTIGGGNLSLQVHPLTEYIRDQFGMTYTQDESYYILDATEDAAVYLGLKENVDKDGMIKELVDAQRKAQPFDADKYTQKWPAKKHDHFLIPAGTVHCSGQGCMVLEISATPYIFTFKLYDWGRLGLDGKPRAINIEHGAKVIQWDRQPEWTKGNLINNNILIKEEKGCREEQTGLHQLQFIETRRYWQSEKVTHTTGDGVNVLMIVEGEGAVVESPTNLFDPFFVNFGEAFIIPTNVEQYSIRPKNNNEKIVTIKAYVRT